ncbi:MAG TPA: hypothetical protein VJC04_03865 [Candidatus Paceibacterota bacterium]
MEGLTQTKFSKEAKFEEIQFQTEDDIKKKYGQGEKYTVELVFDYDQQWVRDLRRVVSSGEFDNLLKIDNIPPEKRKYFVFVKEVK